MFCRDFCFLKETYWPQTVSIFLSTWPSFSNMIKSISCYISSYGFYILPKITRCFSAGELYINFKYIKNWKAFFGQEKKHCYFSWSCQDNTFSPSFLQTINTRIPTPLRPSLSMLRNLSADYPCPGYIVIPYSSSCFLYNVSSTVCIY